MTKYRSAGLILEGGATRGIFTAGVLDYLMEQDFYFPYVVGVSAGACNAIDYVSKQPGRTKACMMPQENKEYNYLSLKKTLKNKSLFDMDLIFDRFPMEVYPFDFETYFQSPVHCELVVTNCLTGRAEYLNEKSRKDRLMKISRASSSIPLACPMVTVDNIPYLDGGIADSIPIIHSLKTGHKKNVLVLTRNLGYRKKPIRKSRALYQAALRDYPNLTRTLFARARNYNKVLEYIEKWEREGRIFVIRPQIKTVSRTERNEQTLSEFYQHGYDIMKEQFEAMQTYLNT